MPYTVTENGEVLLYDFTLSDGDYFGATDIYIKNYIQGKTHITMENGEERDLFPVWQSVYCGCEEDEYDEALWLDGYGFDTVVSGIGSRRYLVGWLISYPLPIDGNMYKNWLNVFITDNELVYKSPQYFKDLFFDNLVTGISAVKPDAKHDIRSGLYDLSGRKVEDKPRAGVYIYNGRKVVVK